MPEHIHIDGITVLLSVPVLILDLAILRGIATWLVANYPNSAAAKAFGWVLALPTSTTA